MYALRWAVGGLFTVVPNGWLFHVMVVSPQAAPTRKASSVRQTPGRALTYSRSRALFTAAAAGIAGRHLVRSKRTYGRRLAAFDDCESTKVAVPLVPFGALWFT